MHNIELLSPAANAETAIEAILHGADAVYIGPPDHGARKAASNSIDDIARVVEFAHQFRAKVYVTVNTIIFDSELKEVERMIWDLWRIGVDALIVQDMGILRLNLPPIALHASTQCDTRTPEKARFLEEAGFSQIVLARELTLPEIKAITDSVSVPVECFIHGALCVSYSGVCHASQATCGRSANRGECAQLCRLPYTLRDADGRVVAKEKHLLSLKDFNLSDRLEDLMECGVSSFKIEGRLKGIPYVKNITTYYNQLIERIISTNPKKYQRSSCGRSEVSFTPSPDKSFNRGFTHYFFDNRRQLSISEPRTPKSMGEPVGNINSLNPGDGISWFNEKGEYVGIQVNRIERGRIFGKDISVRYAGLDIHRTADREWDSRLSRQTATRKLALDISIDENGISANDERGVAVRIPLEGPKDVALKPMDPSRLLGKLGNTIFYLREFRNHLNPSTFIPASSLNEMKRVMLDNLQIANRTTYPLELRRKENRDYPYPVSPDAQQKEGFMDYHGNVSNRLAEKFYRDHGVDKIEPSVELKMRRGEKIETGISVMTTRHCILREIGLCRKETAKARQPKFPLTLTSGNRNYTLSFDCSRCEMHLHTN